MAGQNATGQVELGQWSTISNGDQVLLKRTKHARWFRIVVRPKDNRPKVRHRRYRGRDLTEGRGIG